MKDKRLQTIILSILGVFGCITFYVIFLFYSELLPLLTKHRFSSEWVYVFIAAIPVLLVLFFILSDKISEIYFGKDGVGFKFSTGIPPSLIESVNLNENISRDYFNKGSRADLDKIVREVGSRSVQPLLLLIPLGNEDFSIDFGVMRQYIYKLSEIAPIKYIVFVGKFQKYLGYTTVEKFRARFPRIGIEYVLEDLADEKTSRSFAFMFNDMNSNSAKRTLEKLVNDQWIPNWNLDKGPARVGITDIGRFGGTDQKITNKSNINNVYWLLTENNLDGIPVVDENDNFIGILTRDKILQSIASQLLSKAIQSEDKK